MSNLREMLDKDLNREELKTFFEELSESNCIKQRNILFFIKDGITLNDKQHAIKEKLFPRSSAEITIISDDIAIARHPVTSKNPEEYYTSILNEEKVMSTCTTTFDEALLLALLYKYKSANAFNFICKSLDMPISKQF